MQYFEQHNKNIQNEFGNLFWDYIVNLKYMFKYYKESKELNVVINISKKSELTETDVYILKNIMQNDFQYGHLNWYINKRKSELKQLENKIFDFLNSTNNPYKYIFTPIWFKEFHRYNGGLKYYKHQNSGVNNVTLFIAEKYALRCSNN
jgi:hypothetical protein